MKIIVLNGSPKKKSDTMRMTQSFLKGIEKNGEHEIEIIDVIKKEIKPCLGCLKCWELKKGICVQNDDMNEVLRKIECADLTIWSFPLYAYSMPSHLKAVLDRLLPLSKKEMKVLNGQVYHEGFKDRERIQTVVLCGCGFPDWKGNFDALRIICKNAFRRNLTTVFVPEAPMFNVSEAAVVAEPLLKKFEAAGKEYAENGCLRIETVAELETPMIDGDLYMKICNGEYGK